MLGNLNLSQMTLLSEFNWFGWPVKKKRPRPGWDELEYNLLTYSTQRHEWLKPIQLLFSVQLLT